MKDKKTRHLLGNILILASAFLLIFTYYPIVKLYLLPAAIPIQGSGYSIAIPKINAYAPVITDVNPWKKEEYSKALEGGIAQAQGHPLFFFAHSSDFPWKITRYNTAFLRLNELQKDDQIIINKDGVKHQYKVIEKKEVWPTEVKYLKEADPNKLVLMTCTPTGTAFKRLLVFAQPL